MWTDFRMPSWGRQGGNAGPVATARIRRKPLTDRMAGCKGAGGHGSPRAGPKVSIWSGHQPDQGLRPLIEGENRSISINLQRFNFAELPWSKPTANPCQSTNPRSCPYNYIHLLLLVSFTNKTTGQSPPRTHQAFILLVSSLKAE